ncbi:MAG: homoserine dehydrogenase [Elusimicrobiota bacterium]
MKKNVVNVGLIGYGTVGGGVADILRSHLAHLEGKAGAKIRLAWICNRSKKALPRLAPHAPRFTRDWRDVTSDPSVDIVVELMGGYEPARTAVLSALKAGKHVATANKALLARYWGEVFRTAQAHRALVYFEAAVGSGIPVIQGLNEGLAANRIEKIYGILNGTTNYILTRMSQEGMSFERALEAAQKAGFAEADPSFDVEGTDAAHKLAVLASLASGGWVRLEQVSRQGIAGLDVWDVRFARDTLGLAAKLLGIVELRNGTFSARVYPALIPASHPFANVSYEYNAVFVHGDAAGDVMFYGKGAGRMAAASAVVSDVVYLARQVANGTAGQIPYVAYEERPLKAVPLSEVRCRHYLRFATADKPGALARIAGVLGAEGVSISSVHQDAGEPRAGGGIPVVLVTHAAREGDVQAALRKIDRLPVIRKKTVHLRIEEAR